MALLDDDQYKLEVIRLDNDGLTFTEIGKELGISRSSIGRFINRETYESWWAKHEKPIASGSLYDHHHNIKKIDRNRFILTSAQNNTFVHSKFIDSLEVAAEFLDAQIIVGSFSYNLNGFQSLAKGESEWFDQRITKYIVDEPVRLAKDLLWCGELNILPTAVNPLSGFHSYTKSSSGIIPHAKIQMESVPSHKENTARMIYTTGAVTQRNYIQKKAGQKAAFHHIFGALIVEVDADGDWFVRQLIADTDSGEFYDLDKLYTPNGVYLNNNVEAVNWGDIHSEKGDDVVYGMSFGRGSQKDGSIIDILKPKYQLVHDVLDFEARNHHTINDPYVRFKNYTNQKDCVKENIKRVGHVLTMMQRPFTDTVIVESNHDLALQRWLKTTDYKTDPANALFFLDCQYATYMAMFNNDNNFSVFEYALKKNDNNHSEVKFLKTDESFMICGPDGIECGAHGDLGLNGSRGSAMAYQKLGSRYNIGHSHSAGIKDGVYQAGVSGKMDMGYNRGPSSWSHSHIITYKNSKRTIITIKNGKWRL